MRTSRNSLWLVLSLSAVVASFAWTLHPAEAPLEPSWSPEAPSRPAPSTASAPCVRGLEPEAAAQAGDPRDTPLVRAPATNANPGVSGSPADLPDRSLTRELRLQRLQELKAGLDGALAGKNRQQTYLASQIDLMSIAVILDAQRRSQWCKGQKVSLEGQTGTEKRFVFDNYLYAFEPDEFPGSREVDQALHEQGAVKPRGAPPPALSGETLASLMDRFALALELLTRGS